MDPLSVAASIVGLLGAGAAVTKFLVSVVNAGDAGSLAKRVLAEVADITVALQHVQEYISGRAQVPAKRQSMVLLEHVLTTLTGCVLTYSDLQSTLAKFNIDTEMDTFDKIKWIRQQARIGVLVQRLQNHKSSLNLILTILQCHSMQKAETSTHELHRLVAKVLESNQDLSTRIRGLERQGSFFRRSVTEVDWTDDDSTIARSNTLRRASFAETEPDLGHTFEDELEASRVYSKKDHRHSLSSITSAAIHTTALSIFSNLSLSQVSHISFYALPIYAMDLNDGQHYIFGERGAVQATSGSTKLDPYKRTRLPPIIEISSGSSETSSTSPLSPRFRTPRQLLGRFASKRRMPISPPYNVLHMTHVALNYETGELSGLPTEWDEKLRRISWKLNLEIPVAGYSENFFINPRQVPEPPKSA